MGSIAVDIFPPAYWQDFEKLTYDISKIEWNDDYAELHGRGGQSQGGVDVIGTNSNSSERIGIQCKKRAIKAKAGSESPSNTLTTKEIDDELKLIKDSQHNLDRFVIATTGPRDSKLQLHVAALNRAESQIKVAIKFWDDYVEFLNDHPELMYRYYENILKYRLEYDSTKHYLHLLSMAFDRPALRTPFDCENRATDFISALSATQQAIATGRLVDRENRVIDQVRVPKPKPKGLAKISNRLQTCRDIVSTALSEGLIIEHATVLEIKDHKVVSKLNDLRSEAIDLLNKILTDNEIEAIEFSGY